MKDKVRVFIGCLCLILCSAISCFAKEWRGIVPLHSTRSDVIKILGKPTHGVWNYQEIFDLENERVGIEWIDPTCVRKYPIEPDSEVQPTDLVLTISVFPKKPISSTALELNPKTLFTTVGCHLPDGPCTLCSDDGFCFTTEKDGVTRIYYSATSDEFKAWMQEHKTCQPSTKGAT
jgi:hypothetical protein